METTNRLQWSELLAEAVNTPGRILEAYSRFHGYSIGNRLAALFQCAERGIEPGPLATFNRWKELGRNVKRGSKALTLCQPVTVKERKENDPDSPDSFKTVFVWRPRWFVLSQTEGAELESSAFAVPQWNKDRALRTLSITEESFTMLDGNVQGYAKGREIAINPLAQIPVKTLFHELAHIVLGHTDTIDAFEIPRSIREVEAEGVALLCLESLGLDGSDYCRGYMQHWLGTGNAIPESNAQRIFKAADTILRAGTEE